MLKPFPLSDCHSLLTSSRAEAVWCLLPPDSLSPPVVTSSSVMPCDVVSADAGVCGDKASQLGNLIGLGGSLNKPWLAVCRGDANELLKRKAGTWPLLGLAVWTVARREEGGVRVHHLKAELWKVNGWKCITGRLYLFLSFSLSLDKCLHDAAVLPSRSAFWLSGLAHLCQSHSLLCFTHCDSHLTSRSGSIHN